MAVDGQRNIVPESLLSRELHLRVGDADGHISAVGRFLASQRANLDHRLCDVRLETCEGGVEHAHSVLLVAHSKKLAEMLNESGPPLVVTLPDNDIHEVTPILDFLYTGEARIRAPKLASLMNLAKFLQLDDLHEKLENRILDECRDSSQNCVRLINDLFKGETIGVKQESISTILGAFLSHDRVLSANDISTLPAIFVKHLISARHFTTAEKLKAINIGLTWMRADLDNRQETICQNAGFSSFGDKTNGVFREDLRQKGANVHVGRDRNGAVYVAKGAPLPTAECLVSSSSVNVNDDADEKSLCNSMFASPYGSPSFIEELREMTDRLGDPFGRRVAVTAPARSTITYNTALENSRGPYGPPSDASYRPFDQSLNTSRQGMNNNGYGPDQSVFCAGMNVPDMGQSMQNYSSFGTIPALSQSLIPRDRQAATNSAYFF
ncbi:unnamed protein product, partial [Mesorhabditis spiculigera]